MLGGLLQLLRPLLASLLQRPAVFFNPLQQVIQTQGQHPQVGDGHSSSLWRCGGTTWQGCTGGLLPESHQDNRELQDSTSAHDEEWTWGPREQCLHWGPLQEQSYAGTSGSKSTLVLGEPWRSAVAKVWCELQDVKSEATASQGGEEFTESPPAPLPFVLSGYNNKQEEL